jgi:hypothetical protein
MITVELRELTSWPGVWLSIILVRAVTALVVVLIISDIATPGADGAFLSAVGALCLAAALAGTLPAFRTPEAAALTVTSHVPDRPATTP